MDTATRTLRQAWRLVHSDTSEIPVNKLLELLKNLELLSGETILDRATLRTVESFIAQNGDNPNLVIKFDEFGPFYENLTGTSLKAKIGTPLRNEERNVNFNESATTNFINRELSKLKKQGAAGDREIGELNEEKRHLREGRSAGRTRSSWGNDLSNSDPAHNPANSSDVIQKIHRQLQIQSRLVKDLKSVQQEIQRQRAREQQADPSKNTSRSWRHLKLSAPTTPFNESYQRGTTKTHKTWRNWYWFTLFLIMIMVTIILLDYFLDTYQYQILEYSNGKIEIPSEYRL